MPMWKSWKLGSNMAGPVFRTVKRSGLETSGFIYTEHESLKWTCDTALFLQMSVPKYSETDWMPLQPRTDLQMMN